MLAFWADSRYRVFEPEVPAGIALKNKRRRRARDQNLNVSHSHNKGPCVSLRTGAAAGLIRKSCPNRA